MGQRSGRQLQALVEWSLGATFDNQALLDIGDNFQWSVPAKRVRVSLIFPFDSAQIVDSDPEILNPAFTGVPGGSWLAEVSATVSSAEDVHQFSSISSHTLTEVKIPTGDIDLFFVPPLARAVAVYADPLVVAPVTPMRWLATEDPAVSPVAELEFITTTPKTAKADALPGHAIGLQRPAGYLGKLAVVWTIRPS